MSTQIGVIAEDQSDYYTLNELTLKLARANSFRFRRFAGGGGSMILRKGRAWALDLKGKGCRHLVVVHDLDNRREHELRSELSGVVSGTGFTSSLILIPIREIEAWLLCDDAALKEVFRAERLPLVPSNPESISDPKLEIARCIRTAGGSIYVNTIHNPKIAKQCSVGLIEKRCQSFRPYVAFIRSILPAL